MNLAEGAADFSSLTEAGLLVRRNMMEAIGGGGQAIFSERRQGPLRGPRARSIPRSR